jgi:hypothetical protein
VSNYTTSVFQGSLPSNPGVHLRFACIGRGLAFSCTAPAPCLAYLVQPLAVHAFASRPSSQEDHDVYRTKRVSNFSRF